MTDAITPDTFDVLSFIEHTSYPTSEVTLYTDSRSAAQFEAELAARNADEAAGNVNTDRDARLEELAKAIAASGLTFKLRGLAPGVVRELFSVDESASDDEVRSKENDLIAKTIAGVKNASGAVDTRVWDAAAVDAIRRHVKEGEVNKLVTGVINVNFNASVFDAAVDAGFLGGSSDVG